MPPPLTTTLTMRRVFRYTNAEAGVFSPTNIQIGQRALVFGTSATTVSTMIRTFKLLSVEVWAPPDPTTFYSTASCELVDQGGGLSTQSQIMSDTSLGSALPAHFKMVPKPGSYPAMFVDGVATGYAVSLTLPANSIVDITLEFNLNDATNSPGSTTVTSATVGVIYMLSLATGLVPVSFPTTS